MRLFFKGEVENAPAPLRLRVEDSAGCVATAIHPDADAVPTTEWTSWSVPFTGLGAAGVDLGNIKSLYLGVGDPDDASPSGSRTVYIDDIQIGRQRSSE